MADSIPSLRRKLNEANARIAELEAKLAEKPAEVVRVEFVDRPVEVVREVVKTEYVEVPFEVTRTVVKTEYVDRVVREYSADPEMERTIEVLQERLRECQSISQSGS